MTIQQIQQMRAMSVEEFYIKQTSALQRYVQVYFTLIQLQFQHLQYTDTQEGHVCGAISVQARTPQFPSRSARLVFTSNSQGEDMPDSNNKDIPTYDNDWSQWRGH